MLTTMLKTATVAVATAAALTLVPSPASAAPADPHAWVLHEAQQMGCKVDYHESLPIGPRNFGVSCIAHGQRFDVLFYRRIADAVDWWQRFVVGHGAWMTRDGLVLVIPQGAVADGDDSGLYRRDEATLAADALGGQLRHL